MNDNHEALDDVLILDSPPLVKAAPCPCCPQWGIWLRIDGGYSDAEMAAEMAEFWRDRIATLTRETS